MALPLREQINNNVKEAMRAGDARKRDALRLLTAALKQKEVDERVTLADADVVAIIDKMLKQRRDSIAQFEKGGRQDLADTEKYELGVLQAYMPQALSEAEIADAVAASIAESGLESSRVFSTNASAAQRTRRTSSGGNWPSRRIAPWDFAIRVSSLARR